MVKVKYRAKIHKVRIPKALRQKLARTNLQDYSERLSTLEFDRYIDDDRKQVSSNKKATKQIVQIQRKANLNFLQRIFGKVSFDDSSYDQDLITLNE
ncbi:MAG TPA: hypothetical protein ENI73_06170 [Spirochaetes bacterium]|nr:hypothetical protein [Spirochaetota bacterium]